MAKHVRSKRHAQSNLVSGPLLLACICTAQPGTICLSSRGTGRTKALVSCRWADIAKHLPGRTENSVKNHWNATLRRTSKHGSSSHLVSLKEYMKEINLQCGKVCCSCSYMELMHRLCEKAECDVSLKYLVPGEDLHPDNLISVTGNDDVQVARQMPLCSLCGTLQPMS